MYSQALLFVLAASPLVAAHGKIAVVTGDAGGNGTGIGIMGAAVAGAGKNKQTELDTTVFAKTDIATDGLGKTSANGKNTADMMTMAMAQSGTTLPQVSADGTGTIQGTYHIVTTDGAGPIQAMLDTTGTGAFSSGTMLAVNTQVPGTKGNIKAPKRSLYMRAMDTIMKRAANVNEDYPMAFSVPAGTTCSGTAGGQSNVCMVKIANSNPAGPFGGVIAIQMAPAGAAATGAPAARRSQKFSS